MNKVSLTYIVISLIIGFALGCVICSPAIKLTTPTHSMQSMSNDLGNKDKEFDKRFIDQMTIHHQGAIDMANQALQNSDREEIKKLSKEIIDAQTKEIDQMKKWKEQWYKQ